ncbi:MULTISPECIES: tyrosine-type recombinase/integrase [Streptomyces violaceusniger group]|uniref:Tyrosine-type recombinase/integrase n=2 Tax=Streptomyces rhizosphaericus TaxID=114699 RepID=A0ABN1SA68_9ACTN|nr:MULTISPECIES: tyrosine-type recombinase/integrase [Streptomyces violaceusniger group]
MTYGAISSLPQPFRSEKALSPVDGSPMWVVVDPDYQLHHHASAYLDSLRGAEDASVNTGRTYAGRIALYLCYCVDHGIDWAAPSMRQLAGFLNWLVDEPMPSRGRRASAEPKHRSKSTANAVVGTVFRFLRYCALLDDDPVSADLAAKLYEPKQLRYAPPGYDCGEEGQFSTVDVKTIKFKVVVPGYEYLTGEEIRKVLDCTVHARDRLLVALLAVTGIRIGEALGLRREDMHLLASSKVLGCSVAGPHIHVRRRQNANGALAKTRKPRWIPVGEDIGGLYADYQWERDRVREAADCDMVFVNLFAAPLGQPMKYPSTYELFQRLAKKAGFPTRPHMLRHSAITRWRREGKPDYLIMDMAGHVSRQSMDQYTHASDQEKRDAVNHVAALGEARS